VGERRAVESVDQGADFGREAQEGVEGRGEVGEAEGAGEGFAGCGAEVWEREMSVVGEEAEGGDGEGFVDGERAGEGLEQGFESGGWDSVRVVVVFQVLADSGNWVGEGVVGEAPVAV